MTAHSRLGVIEDLVAHRWVDPNDGQQKGIKIDRIEIADTLEGREAELVRACHGDKHICVVHDSFTREALGGRLLDALRRDGLTVSEYVWNKPKVELGAIRKLSEATADAEVLIAVGSGSVSDGCKYATFEDGREYSVFATSPMNAYTTPTASLSVDGFKKSITCHFAKGVFFDLGVIAKCPPRLVSAAFADVVCRTTAQSDWLLMHLLYDTPYSETAYTLLAYDEDDMIALAPKLLEGDFEALARLVRVSAIMGSSTSFTGTTHVGSMAEHMISHCIDMFAGSQHPGTSHGEQVGVASLTMSRLQNETIALDAPPELKPTVIPVEQLAKRYGEAMARTMAEETEKKAFDEEGAARMNDKLRREWPQIKSRLAAVTRPFDELHNAMAAAGCQLTAADLGLPAELYRQYVGDARFIRDRFSMLDLADDSGRLEPFLATVN
ncbi:iron-containing alcohol dehydrogenase [Jiella marina]|uniref:iron-containing alcohol dehydrogenase n=1 Tax=Jiella sp. LLJ827 TaxID=2917712 RepID=UPI0021019844|nr:iron-containing alcohol dehydrogenase [Jiella sp. LLJ827]MCQ0986113.1 iron-containing alcohol dehydrogenase [Jiella sp. LLJ827]